MFAQLAVLAAFVAPLVSALTVDPLVGATSGGRTNITWEALEGDPATFSVELRNPIFNNHFAIANNVDASLQSWEVLLPIVPAGDQYFLDLVNIGNITDVFASSAPFSIGETVTTTSSGSTTSTGSSTLPSTASGSSLSTPSGSASVPTVTPPSTTGTGTGTGTGTTTTALGTSTPFNENGAAALGFTGSNAVSYGLMVAGAFAGAVLVGF